MITPFFLTLNTPQSLAEPCRPIPGIERVVSNKHSQWIVVGEQHGTQEIPDAFVDLVCAFSTEQKVVVALEQPQTEQPFIDAYIRSSGTALDREAFLKSPLWHGKVQFGTSSQAIMKMFDRLRDLYRIGRVSAVVAFVPRFDGGAGSFNQADWEKRLALALVSQVPAGPPVLTLTGNLHAGLIPFSNGSGLGYQPMASYLPRDKTVSIDVRFNGGTAWNCTAMGCGSHALSAGLPHDRSFVPEDRPRTIFSGYLYLGTPVTASPPEVSGIPSG